jgi:putative phosphoesterase
MASTRGRASTSPALAHERRDIAASSGGLRLALVADTHSKPHPLVHERLQALQPAAILHAGDIGDPRVIDELGSIAPVHAVRGNIDGRAEFPDVLTLRVKDGASVLFSILLLHIAVYGPRLRPEAKRLAAQEDCDLVVCGHSHVPFAARWPGVAVFNPGSIGPRRFELPIVFGTLDLSAKGVQLRHVDCETGDVWSPPPSSTSVTGRQN